VGADQYAADIMTEVATDLRNAQDIQSNKHRDVKMEFTYARSATERAEDARLVTLRKEQEQRQQEAQDAKMKAQQDAQQSQLQASNARAAADAAAAAQAQAEAAKARADAEAANARAQAAQASQQAETSKQEAEATREKLRAQLNSVLATTESARGLVVNLGDVLFDTGKADLNPGASRNLDQLVVFLTDHPERRVQIDGFTDSVGTDSYNMSLSQARADTVKSSLVSRGIDRSRIGSQGYGKGFPVATNDESGGRQLNRRVEVVIGGDDGASIGVRG